MSEHNFSRSTYKLVLLGNSGVGKTSLVNYWVNGVSSEVVKPTVGANHQKKTIEVDGVMTDFFIWDTAGQEQFQALTPLYTRSAACAIVVAANNDLSSFQACTNWINCVKNSCTNMPPIVFAVNKIDLDGVMTKDEIEKQYKSLFHNIFYVSAHTGENADSLFQQSALLAVDFMKTQIESVLEHQVRSLETEKEKKKSCC